MGILLAAVMYVCCNGIGQHLITERFLSDKAVERNVGNAYESLNEYIRENNVEGTDNEQLSHWLKKNNYTYLFVYDNYGTAFEAGWSEESHSGISQEAFNYDNETIDGIPRIDKDNYTVDVRNRIVNFADQEYYVFIDMYKEQVWYGVLNIITIVVCFLTLLATLLVYNATVLRRIRHFSEEVKCVADGDLEGEIHNIHNDEIGKLATSVDNMRESIIQKHEDEKMAWQANRDLITAMSHDIRSPLTSIIGYLDIIQDKIDENPEELRKYIEACRAKAFKLKDFSDELFQYFLVFGNEKENIEFEIVDAALLLQQILGEHCAELHSEGYNINVTGKLGERKIKVDITGMRRLFDNIFHNIKKYADADKPVKISASEEEEHVVIKISNSIPAVRRKVESTKIGIKTCIKICENMGGAFRWKEEENFFTVEINLPLQ